MTNDAEMRGLEIMCKFLEQVKEQADKGYDFMIVWDLPPELCKTFDEKIVKPHYHYPGKAINVGRSKAICDLMGKAIQEHKQEERNESKAEEGELTMVSQEKKLSLDEINAKVQEIRKLGKRKEKKE